MLQDPSTHLVEFCKTNRWWPTLVLGQSLYSHAYSQKSLLNVLTFSSYSKKMIVIFSLHIKFFTKIYHVFYHCFIKLCPHKSLNLCSLILHITNNYGQHFIIDKIKHMTSHSCPTNMFHMIKHDHAFCKSPTSCIHVMRLISLLTPFINILKMNTFCPWTCLRKQHSWMLSYWFLDFNSSMLSI